MSATLGPLQGVGKTSIDLSLRAVTRRAFIACYRENVDRLRAFLLDQGFETQEARGSYSETELGYSQNIRCLLTHRRIWEECARLEGPSLVVEADFVPVRDFGGRRVPGGWLERPGFAWLYSVSPTFYRVDRSGAAIGEGAGTVAYLVEAPAAQALLDFAEEILSGPNPGQYRLWETEFRLYLRHRKGVPTYVPYRHYGEHGGRPNPEHYEQNRFPPHRADCLAGPLAFLPDYAEGSRLRAYSVRAAAKLKGVARLLLGRMLPPRSFRNEPSARLIRFVVSRLLTVY